MNKKSLTFYIVMMLTLTAPFESKANVIRDFYYDNAVPFPADKDVLYPIGLASTAELPKKMRFLVWNLYKGSEPTFKADYRALSQDKEILVNQEMFLDHHMINLFRSLDGQHYNTATSFFSGQDRIRTGVATASKVEASSVEFIRTQKVEPIVSSPKVTLITRYPIEGTNKTLTVVNIHSINFVSTSKFQFELNRIFEKLKSLPAPVVFAGDFNTWNNERTRILHSYARQFNMKFAAFNPDYRMTFNNYPLDHFLHTTDLTIVSAKADKNYKGSDHSPLEIEVEYTEVN